MSIDIRLPNINGATDSEQLEQIRSYLYQFASQLQWALGEIEAGGSGVYIPITSAQAGGSLKKESITNFNELKSLIIKSADFVEAIYDPITKLIDANNKYVAVSRYGTFEEQTNNVLYGDGDGLVQQIDNIQSIFDEDGNIIAERLVNGHIYSGIIEYAKDDKGDGEAIIGIEIGQTTTYENGEKKFDAFARFTANRLSFYDANGIEVAYISDSKLLITNAWVKGDLELGIGNSHFVLETNEITGISLKPI